jgi:hypothetical protein
LGGSNAKIEWGTVEGIGKGTKASYNSQMKILTFCFNRGPETSGEALRLQREVLMRELKDLGYSNQMKYNGEVIADNVNEDDVVLVKKNHKLLIRLNKKQPKENLKSIHNESGTGSEGESKIRFI